MNASRLSLVAALVLITSQRLPAPIQEIQPSLTAAPERSHKPKAKPKVASEKTEASTNASKSPTPLPRVSGESGGVNPFLHNLPYIGGEGTVAVMNVDSKLNTTATFNWSGFIGTSSYFVVFMSETPPSPNWISSAHAIATIGSWKTSAVIHGLAPGTYYFAIGKSGAHLSNISRVVIGPGK